ncbi:MAG TPA: DUF2911 domain-containing protein [Verrucomicrobiae bacterium]|nr:DUF2911 domain-containing protein [Verrucomicrobiae bacterium]
MNSKILGLTLAAVGLLVANAAEQAPRVEFPAPSPASTLKQRVGLTDVEIVYSRPSVKGRKIFGGLVSHGEVWRTGANTATRITFSTPVRINGAEVPAGTYGLFTIPGENEWTVIISKGSEQWGSYRYDQKDDLVRVKAKPEKLAQSVETFTIGINDLRDDSATLAIEWEKVRVPVKIEVDLVNKLKAQIDQVMASNEARKPYFQAAMFYYDHNLDLQKAKEWVNAAVAEREAFYIVHLQAKILAKTGDKAGAIKAANRSTELAKQANDSGYVTLNRDLIASLK